MRTYNKHLSLENKTRFLWPGVEYCALLEKTLGGGASDGWKTELCRKGK